MWAMVAAAASACGLLAAEPNAAVENHASVKPYVCLLSTDEDAGYDHPGVCPQDGFDLIRRDTRLRIAMLVFPDVEDIDLAGPAEVFAASGNTMFTVAATTERVRSVSGMAIAPDFDLEHAPPADVLLVPGGGVADTVAAPKVIAWVRERSAQTRITMSVCNGAFVLAAAGVLDGHAATTTAPHLARLAREFPRVQVVRDRRYVDDGRLITTGGLSAGIDGALHLVEREQGTPRAAQTARYLEYDWKPDPESRFGNLARYGMPPMKTFVAGDMTWERSIDEGTASEWQIAGVVKPHLSAAAFLDRATEALRGTSWTYLEGAPASQRNFCKVDGPRRWVLRVALVPRAPEEYDLSVAMSDRSGASYECGAESSKVREKSS